MIKNDNYMNIQGWMVNELELKGNELMVYAIIYGFTQDEKSWFTGSATYLSNWTSTSKNTIYTALKKLTEKGYIIKENVQTDNNMTLVKYKCSNHNKYFKDPNKKFNNPNNNLDRGTQETGYNNTNKININNTNKTNTEINSVLSNNSNINNNDIVKEDIVKNKEDNILVKKKKKNNKNDWATMQKMIDTFTTNEDVLERLKLYYNQRKKTGLTPEQLQLILDKLRKDCGDDANKAIESINNSYASGWRMIYTSNYNSNSRKSNFDNTANHEIKKGISEYTKKEKEEYYEKLPKDKDGNIIGF